MSRRYGALNKNVGIVVREEQDINMLPACVNSGIVKFTSVNVLQPENMEVVVVANGNVSVTDVNAAQFLNIEPDAITVSKLSADTSVKFEQFSNIDVALTASPSVSIAFRDRGGAAVSEVQPANIEVAFISEEQSNAGTETRLVQSANIREASTTEPVSYNGTVVKDAHPLNMSVVDLTALKSKSGPVSSALQSLNILVVKSTFG